MPIPQVAIVGRPNVGKSSLFNWLVDKRLAIVDDTPGVTRDRVGHIVERDGRWFELIDTGGIGFDDPDNLSDEIERQIEAAISSAAAILFVVDALVGLTPYDEQVAQRLRAAAGAIICVANKADAPSIDPLADEFHRLGFPLVLRTSAHQNRGREELFEAILDRLPPANAADDVVEPVMKIAIVGRRNTGKSTFVNTLSQSERMIVSEVPGTTRDSVDVRFELDGQEFVAIDTPGLRRRKSVSTDIDFYSLHRAQRSIRRADVVLLFFDAAEPIGKVDMQLSDYIAEQYKPCLFVVNKWDLMAGTLKTGDWADVLRDTLRTMAHVPIAFITGQTGRNVKTLINHAQMLFKQSRARVGTAELNRVLIEALERNPPPRYKNHQPKIYYATQVDIQPPAIVLFANSPGGLDPTYRRYLLGAFRDELPFGEVPIKLYVRRRESNPEASAKSRAGESRRRD